jgi:hypothetical protein
MADIDISLPTLHVKQIEAYKLDARFKAIRCGRRFGKTALAITIGCDMSIRSKYVGIFAPDYKILSETYREIYDILQPLIKNASKVDGVIRLIGGGRIDFWTLNNPRAGRSRKYHLALIDEAAFAGDDMMTIWRQAIKPSLLDYKGSCIVLSTPNGADTSNFFYRICTEPEHGFVDFHAPTHTNPYLPKDELDKLEKENHPMVYRQEYLAEFVDWSGAAFFTLDKMLVDGAAVPYPFRTDQVFAVVDTALKDGLEHDGTAVIYCARNKIAGTPLIILDWDVIQISGDLLENWIPSVAARCEELARLTNARQGNVGIWIEDKASGIVLIQQSQRKGMKVHSISGALTAAGKDGRAVMVSSYFHQSMVKISDYAYNKVVVYKEQSKNHLISQVCGFRLGAKTPHHLDLFDCFCYSLAIALGDQEGY